MENQGVVQAMVVAQASVDSNQGVEKMALFYEDGTPIDMTDPVVKGDKGDQGDPGPTATGANVLLTGFVAGVADDVEATDTLNAAIAKLEARIAALETP